jgi:shikimate dehydrogenase
VGWPLKQTFSPSYFAEKFRKLGVDASYDKFPIEHISDFPDLLVALPDLRGVNVTIPHKSAIMPFLNALSDDANAIGAVNCIDIRNGVLTGYNTDWIGFRDSLAPLLQPHHNHALVLGSGGAAKAIIYALGQMGINPLIVSRQASEWGITYAQLTKELMQTYTVIINTTPLGMAPNIETAPPIPYEHITQNHLLYDVVYTPSETKFLNLGSQQGAVCKNGLEMLHLQAEASWEIWTKQ